MTKNVLITGGAGFIGQHLTRLLIAAGHQVTLLDTLSSQVHGDVPDELQWLCGEGIRFVRGSTTVEKELRRALEGVDTVVHLAAETGTGQSMYQIAHYTDVNVGGTALLMDVLANDTARKVKRVVLASSRAIYGEGAYVCETCAPKRRRYPEPRSDALLRQGRWEHECPDCGATLKPVPTREDDKAMPASIYAASKDAQEDIVKISCKALGIDYAILRLQNVYGEGQSLKNPYTGILSIFATRGRHGQVIPIFEDGLETRDFVHVQDVAKAFKLCIEEKAAIADVFNVGTGLNTSVMQIASTLMTALGVAPALTVTQEYRLGDIRHNYASMEKLENRFGFRSGICLETGIKRFVDWVMVQPAHEDLLDNANMALRRRGLMK
jgi:dTDP-L-rhamnose 4-epimerase